MPTFKRDDVSIYYEEYGSGYPILTIRTGRDALEYRVLGQEPVRSDQRTRG